MTGIDITRLAERMEEFAASRDKHEPQQQYLYWNGRHHERNANADIVAGLAAELRQLAQQGEVGGVAEGYTLVPNSALAWLNGESDLFECPPDLYFKGAAPPYWWRSEFRRRIALAPQPKDAS